MGRRTYTDDFKAEVMAALLAGQSVSAVAREYDIPKGTVSGWKKKAAPFLEQSATQKKDVAGEIGTLILDLLTAELQALRKMTAAFSDPDWLRQQEASELAVLYGVMQDKVFRKLEALNAADDNAAEG